MARKGDLQAVRYVNLGMDAELSAAILASAQKNERRLAEECRYAVRVYLGLTQAPAEDTADVSA